MKAKFNLPKKNLCANFNMPDCSMTANFEMSNGTKNYEKLENKPSINGVELVGNKTSANLGLATSAQGALAESALQEVPSYYVTETELASELSTKQNVINDLSQIREGASLGATSVQPDDISDMATKEWIAEQGYTSNAVKSVNGNLPDTSGNVVITVPSQVNADWNATSGVAEILNKPTIPTDTGDLTNNAGYIKGISSLDVTNALGYVPYNSSNPNNYITSSALNGYATENWVVQQDYLTGITSAQVTGALGYTPVNPSSLSNVATSGSYNDLSNKPTIGNGTVTFTQGGATKGTITMNQSGDTTIEFEQGGGSGTVTDVEVNGESVVTGGVAEIDLSNYQEKLTAGTDLEIIAGSGAILPNTYEELEYIQSDGACYIDTGIISYGTDTIEQKFQKLGTSTTTCSWFGSMQSTLLIRVSIGSYFRGSDQQFIFFGGFNYTQGIGAADTNEHIMKLYGGSVVELDGASTIYTPQTGTNPTVTSYLFARHGYDTVNTVYDNEGTRIFYHKQKRISGTELLDLVPARRIADGKLGFYNLVNNTFLTNSGSGTLTGGNVVTRSNNTVINFTNESGYARQTDVDAALALKQDLLVAGTDLEIVEGSILPAGYVQLTSITSTGTQWINSGIKLTNNFKSIIVGRFVGTQISNFRTVLAAQNNNLSVGKQNVLLGWGNATNGFYTEPCTGPTYVYSSYPWDTNTHTFTTNVTPTVTTLDIDGVIDTINSAPSITGVNLAIFARLVQNNTVNSQVKFELNSIVLYQSGVLVFNGVPAKRNADGEIGLYETVSDTFLTNSGTGTFDAGAEVPADTVINFTNDSGYIKSGTVAEVLSLQIGNTSLSEAQLQSLLGLI